MNNIKLIEYEKKYAKSLAEMWRLSSESWGRFSDMTEEKVIAELETLSFINIFLAVNNETEVIGYCSLVKYPEDIDTLYIKYLNVRPDFHGTGAGKKLILKALERTIELGYSRLDLMTWPGNTKAIPLYKKCGFSYDARDWSTYMMNFLPYVSKTQAVKSFFEKADLLKDLNRILDIEPDGRKENGFTFFRYEWKKDNQNLIMEFEKTGRGLTLLETNDFLISTFIENPEPVYGQNYNINYKIINKTKTPLNISITGIDNENIKYGFTFNETVSDTKIIEGEFFVEEFNGELTETHTYPLVCSKIVINGSEAYFKTGIAPKHPLEINLSGTNSFITDSNPECFLNKESNIYLEIKNNYNRDIKAVFILPEDDKIEFSETKFEIFIKAGEKRTISNIYTLKDFCFYNKTIPVKIKFNDDDFFDFNTNITSIFKGRTGFFGGESKDFYFITSNGKSLKFDKKTNRIHIREFENETERIMVDFPKIGKPYTSEFSGIKPETVKWYVEKNEIYLEIKYTSNDNQGIVIDSIFKISEDGIISNYYKVYNEDKFDKKDLYLMQRTYPFLTGGIVPVNNKIVEFSKLHLNEIESFNAESFSENWIFAATESAARSVFWKEKRNLLFDEWLFGFEYLISELKAESYIETPPVYFAINTFKSWKELRNYLNYGNCIQPDYPVEDTEIRINKGNPFIDSKFSVEIIEHKDSFLTGQYNFIAENKTFDNFELSFNDGKELNMYSEEVVNNQNFYTDTLLIEQEEIVISYETKKKVYIKQNKITDRKIITENGKRVFSLNNGILTLKASPDFIPALHTLEYKGFNFLDTSFPEPITKSWFNPWFGGLLFLPYDLSEKLLPGYEFGVDFAELKDNFDNIWNGLKTEYTITSEENERFYGLKFISYYLTLPGIPVMCHTTQVINTTERYFMSQEYLLYNFFNYREKIEDNYTLVKTKHNETIKYKSGAEQAWFRINSSPVYCNKNSDEKLQIYTDFKENKTFIYINKDLTGSFIQQNFPLKPFEKRFTSPVFYIISNEQTEESYLSDLKNIFF